jgi:TolB protein
MALWGAATASAGLIVRVSADLARLDTIYLLPGLISAVAWAPDYGRLVFSRNAALLTLSADGAVELPLPTPGHAFTVVSATSWSPDGSRIAIAAESDLGCGLHIYRLSDGSLTRVTLPRDECLLGVAWSPDGSRVAYIGGVTNDPQAAGLYTVRPDGGDVRTVTVIPRLAGWPAWSPDGQRIAFVSTEGGPLNLWVTDLATGVRTRLTTTPPNTAELTPAWSPDGSVIRVARGFGSQLEVGIWEVPATGGTATRVVPLAQAALALAW